MRLSEIKIPDYKYKIHRDGNFEYLGHSFIKKPDCILTFCDRKEFIETIIENKQISCLITTDDFSVFFKDLDIGLITYDNPRELFFKIHNIYGNRSNKTNQPSFIHPSAEVSEKAVIADKNVIIGENSIVHDYAIIHSNTRIGKNCEIGSFTTIGGEGFQFWRCRSGIMDVKHYGGVIIGDNCILKEYNSIHKALFQWDNTLIGNEVKIDSHAHIGHGNKIQNHIYICSHANISGNSIIEDNCYIGPGVNIPNRIIIHTNSKLSVGATVTKDIPKDSIYSGNFAIEHQKFIKYIKSISE